MKYKILQDCYYGEKGQRHKFMTAGTIYESETLKPENAPKYFKLIEEKKAPQAPAPTQGLDMSYNDMKKFVKENDIETVDSKKENLEPAIIEFLAKKAELSKEEAQVQADAEKQALELKNNPAPKDEEGESQIVNGDDNEE